MHHPGDRAHHGARTGTRAAGPGDAATTPHDADAPAVTRPPHAWRARHTGRWPRRVAPEQLSPTL